jgi:hypothetical protein
MDSLELVLEYEMTQSASYDSKKDLKIEAYKTIASNPDIDNRQRTQYLFNVIEEFEKYSFDSTLFYAEKVLNLAKAINDQGFWWLLYW